MDQGDHCVGKVEAFQGTGRVAYQGQAQGLQVGLLELAKRALIQISPLISDFAFTPSNQHGD